MNTGKADNLLNSIKIIVIEEGDYFQRSII